MKQQEADFAFEPDEDGGIVITKYSGSGGELVIPGMIEGKPVTAIGKGAFYECSGLTSLVIPEGVTSIGEKAFYGGYGLTSMDILESVTAIGHHAFYGCGELKSVVIPKHLSSIDVKDVFPASAAIK